MLKYGFDFGDTVSAQIDSSKNGFGITSSEGPFLTSSSAELFYDIKSSMPVLEAFERLDADDSTYVDSDINIAYHETFNFENSSGYNDIFYGLQLRYAFSEDVFVTGQDSIEAYNGPLNAYYVKGKNDDTAGASTNIADFLNYTYYTHGGSNLPDTTTTGSGNNANGYAPFVSNGSLLQSTSIDTSDPSSSYWYHLAYLSLDSGHFASEVSEHDFSVRPDDRYIANQADNIPAIFGYIDSITSSSFTGSYFYDEHGNPARIASEWYTTSASTQELKYDTQAPELLAATALDVASLNSDNAAYNDDYAGTYSIDGDIATFSFALTFSEQLASVDQLKNALVWSISATHITTDADVTDLDTITNDVTVTDTNTVGDDTNYTYTATVEVSGLFNTTGEYTITLDYDNGANPITDLSGTPLDFAAANAVLSADNTSMCYLGTCSFANAPVTLTGFTVDPSLALATTGNTTGSEQFDLTLSFSAPVLFDPSSGGSPTADVSTQNAFNLDYVLLSDPDKSILVTEDAGTISTDDYTDTIAGAMQPAGTATNIDGTDYYSEYVVPFDDTLGLWARSDYGTNIGGSSELLIYLANILTNSRATDTFGSSLNINYLEDFITSVGTYPTIISTSAVSKDNTDIFMVDPANEQNVFTKLKFQLIDKVPEVDSIIAVAANSSNSQNYNSSAPAKRHVRFDITDLDPTLGDAIGMLFLFRTTDNAFTNGDPDTAPYYGAEGGIYISGTDIDTGGTSYHICPPFSKHLDRIGTGMQHTDAPTYNSNRMKIHYLPIPYAADSDLYIYNDTEIAALTSIAVDFTGSLATTEPCVRTTFYNDGEGQYGYIVDSDQEEQHMVIANAMLQDQSGDTADLGMLDPAHLDNVYFDLYSKDYTADSWRRDDRITAKDLVAQITADNLNNSSLHKTDDGIAFQVDTSKLSIFASRFVNSINARFLDSVFLDDLTLADIPAHSYDWKVKHADLLSHSAFDNITDATKTNQYSTISAEDDYFTPNYRNQTPDALVDENDNRLVLSIGVHPSAISVDPGTGTYFQPFETNQASFLKMNPAFYGLYYGGVANTTEPGFDYTSRHLAYINFDLVYELDIDPDTQEITGATLAYIVSPFTLLRHSFFSVEELEARQLGGETYTAVAASIADNVFRHNFTGTSSSSSVQHFLPFGLYCYQPIIDPTSSCYNSQAQMLLPDPNDSANGYQRTIASPHSLHRGVKYFNDVNNYSASISTYDSLNDPTLLERFMRLHVSAGSDTEYRINSSSNPAAPGAIGTNAYTSMLYNSFDRDHAYDYTYNASTEDFAQTYSSDGNYSSSPYEQEYWGVAPFAESPDARADQILPNAFFMGAQSGYYYHTFINHPYQYSSFVQKIHSALGDADDLIDKNIMPRGLDHFVYQTSNDLSWNPSLDTYPSFIFPNDAVVLDSGLIQLAKSSVSSSTYMEYGTYEFDDYPRISPRHIISTSPHTHEYTNHFEPYDEQDYEQHITRVMHYPSYYSGRNLGYLVRDTSYANSKAYALAEAFYHRAPSGGSKGNAFFYRSDQGSRLTDSYDFGETYSPYSSEDGETYYAVLNSDFSYTPAASNNNIQRMFLPHHEDDFDFDRGQIMANKLGFFVDTGMVMDLYTYSGTQKSAYAYSRLFFPSDPAAITSETSSMDPIASHSPLGYDTGNKVANYYPLVLANESLHTTSGTWPVLLTEYSGHPANRNLADLNSEYPWYLDGVSGSVSDTEYALNMYATSYQHAVFPIALDKIFPAGYRYQLGFVNREELFMYDATAGNGDTSSDPTISRFYASAVGNFGYATQYSRLNRRSMQGYHLSTSSQFLGDHLARFSSTPAAGIHTPSELTDVFGHTPVEQGATGTNYGSYAEGYYNLTTTSGSETGGNWRSVSYSGTLRGYVLELRTNPVEQHYREEKTNIDWTDLPGYAHTTTANDLNGKSLLTIQNLSGGIHPEGDF